MRRTLAAVAVLLTVTLALAASAAARPAAPSAVRGAFFTNWARYARGYFVNQIPADRLNVIDYAFAFITPDGKCTLSDPWSDYQAPTWDGAQSVDGVADDPSNPSQHVFGNFNQLLELKAAHPSLRVEISIGGWTGSTYFSDVAATPAARQAFVASCIDLFIKGNLPTGGWPEQSGGAGSAAGLFDGIDVDWEFPGKDPGNGAHTSPNDVANASALLQEFRRQLDRAGKNYLLTVDIPGGNVNSTGSWQLARVAKVVDWIDVMAFDYHGSWDALTNFNSPLALDPLSPPVGGGALDWTFTAGGTLLYFLANGVPADKLNLGIPFYGKEYAGVPAASRGLFQPHPTALANDSPTYHDLVDTGLADANLTPIGPIAVTGDGATGRNGFTRSYDLLAGAPWLYNPGLNGGTFISYVGPREVAARVALVRGLGLRGAWAWEISTDDDAHDLVAAMNPRPRAETERPAGRVRPRARPRPTRSTRR
jgi:chitinase